jgi:hypothetical protein
VLQRTNNAAANKKCRRSRSAKVQKTIETVAKSNPSGSVMVCTVFLRAKGCRQALQCQVSPRFKRRFKKTIQKDDSRNDSKNDSRDI